MPEPFNFGNDLIKIPGLDGTPKMGKSEGNGIYLVDDAKSIEKKVMKAVTDSGPSENNQHMADSVKNLFTLLRVVSSEQTVAHFQQQYDNCTIRYGDLKKQLAQDINQVIAPIREKITEYAANEEYISKVIAMGRDKARENAAKTLKDVRNLLGFRTF